MKNRGRPVSFTNTSSYPTGCSVAILRDAPPIPRRYTEKYFGQRPSVAFDCKRCKTGGARRQFLQPFHLLTVSRSSSERSANSPSRNASLFAGPRAPPSQTPNYSSQSLTSRGFDHHIPFSLAPSTSAAPSRTRRSGGILATGSKIGQREEGPELRWERRSPGSFTVPSKGLDGGPTTVFPTSLVIRQLHENERPDVSQSQAPDSAPGDLIAFSATSGLNTMSARQPASLRDLQHGAAGRYRGLRGHRHVLPWYGRRSSS